MSFQIKIVVVHRDELLIEMTEEYMIYHGGRSDCGNARLYEDD